MLETAAISSSSELATLPRTSTEKLCPTTINIARQIDGMIRLLVKEQGYARIAFDVVRGKLGILRIERSFRMISDD